MKEYYTPGLVLDRVPRNSQDQSVVLYTKELGKVSAISKSIRKITSKLSGHLTAGTIANVRLIDRGSHQLIDALSYFKPEPDEELFRFLSFLDETVPYNQPEHKLWYAVEEIVMKKSFSPRIYRYLLQVMGFESSACQNCKKILDEVAYFHTPDIIFLCSNCLTRSRVKQQDVVPVSQI